MGIGAVIHYSRRYLQRLSLVDPVWRSGIQRPDGLPGNIVWSVFEHIPSWRILLRMGLGFIDTGRLCGRVYSYKAGHALDVEMMTQLFMHDLLEVV